SHFHLNIKGRKKYPFHDEKGAYRNYTLETMASDGVRGRTSMIFPIKGIMPPSGQQWKLGKEKIQMYDLRKDIELKNGKIILKIRPNDENSLKTEPFWAFYPKDIGTAESGKKILNQLMGVREIFDTVKPTGLIQSLLFHSSQKNSIVMDFFAGSSTTADAVMQLNAEDDGHRKFIMVQKPEKTYEVDKETGEAKLDKSGNRIPTKGGKAAYEAGYMTIDPISRERIRCAAKKIRENNKLTLPKDFDGSFKHYRVVKPVKQTLEEIEDFDPNNINLFTDMVDGFSSHALAVDGDATGEETILATWLAKDGYSFDADVEEIKFSNYTAYKVEDNRLYLINEGWRAEQTKELLNKLGTHQLEIQSVVLFGYSFNVAELRELENGLKQLDSKVTLIKRY
ncbi:DNA methyltransferase, partial [Limosilactobacillus fermentum]